MMNASAGASKSASQVPNTTSQALAGTGIPALPLPGTRVPTFIALQQYHFQHSLAVQQLLVQQQAVAQSVSIKAAAEQSASRAAEISRLLQGEKNNVRQDKAEESAPTMEGSESEFHSRSPAFRSSRSKSKSLSPVKYRNRREEDSPRYHSYYRSHRHFNYNSRYDYRRDYYRSSYRRDAYHSGGRRSYLPYHGSRRRSLSRSWSPRYHHYESLSRRHQPGRSPSHNSSRRESIRISRSAVGESDISSSPKSARVMSSRKSVSRESLSPSKSNQSCSTTSLVVKSTRVDNEVNSSETHNVCKQQEKEAKCLREPLSSPCSNSSSKSTFISTDDSGERNTQERVLQKSICSMLGSDCRGCSSSPSSDERLVQRSSVASDDKTNTAPSAIQLTTDKFLLNQQPSREGVDNGHDGIRMVNHKHKNLRSVMQGRRIDQGYLKSLSSNSCSLSKEDSASDNTSQKSYPNEGKNSVAGKMNLSKSHMYKGLRLSGYECRLPSRVKSLIKEGLTYSEDKEKYDQKEMIRDHGAYSEDMIEVEDGSCSTKQDAPNHEVDTLEHAGIPGECAIYPLPEAHENRAGSSLNLMNFEDSDQISTSLSDREYVERRSKRRSRSMRRKHSKKHRKRHQSEESDEDDYQVRRLERRGHRNHKNWKEIRRKRKHWYTSSSDHSSSSSDNDNQKEENKLSRKKSKVSRKKRR